MATFTAYCTSPAGTLLLEAADGYITAISFTETEVKEPEPLSRNDVLDQCRSELEEYFSGRRKTFGFLFRQEGTPFQQEVWRLLAAIPYSHTLSYLQLAKRFGNTKAIRAVGAANGKNRLAIVVPCHRVIGSKSQLVGYAGGLSRKRWLLDHEARHGGGVLELGY